MLSWATSSAARSSVGMASSAAFTSSLRDAQIVDGGAVEPPGELPDGRVALAPDLVEDRLDGLRRPVVAGAGTREQQTQIPGRAPEVQAGERGRAGAGLQRPGGHRDHDGTGMSVRAELSSVATSLDELLGRISRIAEGLTADEREVVGPDLFEVERSLRAARRRVSRLADSAR